MRNMLWLAVLVVVVGSVQGQLTAQTSVAPELRECYTSPILVDRNNLPPATISVLIDIIRKIEDNPNVNVDLRQLAVLLLHTYRQDGIQFHQPESIGASSNVMPYSPTFHSFHRHRLLLTRLIPGNMQVLANDTVSSELKCALHYMLSTTVDARVRGDENTCNQLSQYRALRTARHARSISDDVELLNPALLNQANNYYGQMREFNPDSDVEYTNTDGNRFERQLGGDSTCPLLGGVVSTPWGAVSAGHLIAGIAAGAQTQQVPITELAKNTLTTYNNIQQSVTPIYPATLSGDLAEAALIQGIERGSTSISVGTAGNWNTTQAHRFFMIHSRNNVEMTDPEIRGDIDGFVLGMRSDSFNTLRLSQVLDMYYSPRNGVLNPDLRACNRRELSQTSIADTQLISETFAFAAALDTNMPLRGTITGGLDTLVRSAVTNFQSYATSNMNDMNCITTESNSRDFRLRTNLYIALDASWQYQAVYPAISYLLDIIDVNKFGSSVTLLSAFDGSIVINKTFSLADFHTAYTAVRHQSMLTGINLLTSLGNIRTMMRNELEHERASNYVGGSSTVLLYLLNGNVQNNEQIWEEARMLNETVPDLRILFATSTNQFNNLWNLVRDMHNDIMTVSLTTAATNLEVTMSNVVDRIQQVGRRIINPSCGSDFQADGLSGTRQFDDYLEPGYINFYAISPNYFYQSHDTRRIRITRAAGGVGSLIVCHSRTITHPRQNSTILGLDDNAITCETLTTGNLEISLRNACDGYWTINSCPWFYVSVQSSTGGSPATSVSCSEAACRFPYNMRIQVAIEEFGCFSSAGNVGTSVILILSALAISTLKWF